MDKRNLKYDMNYVNRYLDSHIKIDRGFLDHIVNVLEGKYSNDIKDKLIIQLKTMIGKNIHKIRSKAENSTINKPLFG